MESQGGGPGDSIALSSPAIAHLLEPRSACSLRRNTPMLLPTTHRPETRIDRSLGWPSTEQAQRKRKVSFSPLGEPHAQSRERERMLISESWQSCSGNWKNIYTCVCVSVCVRECACVCARARAYSAYRAQLQGNLAAPLKHNFESRQGGGGERFSAWAWRDGQGSFPRASLSSFLPGGGAFPFSGCGPFRVSDALDSSQKNAPSSTQFCPTCWSSRTRPLGEVRAHPWKGRLSGTGSPSPGLPGPARGEDPGNAGRLQTLNGLSLVTSPGKARRCFHPEGHLLIRTRKCCRGSTRANPPVECFPALGARPRGGQRGEVAGRLGSKGRGVRGIEGAVTSGSDTRRTPLKASNFFMGKNGFSFFN
ncbi:uncharacterized protein LOC111551604 [Piliocolobus tephrosceles]|uniref:uncharacterized protein LOC111551604 n=1 Tax=Piliocolobus tephrosceles TaxID=591936 RepID=UPI000C2A901C|nr:uncharacterized protein LOC111551604 [Piliocolobus tephrosceles]